MCLRLAWSSVGSFQQTPPQWASYQIRKIEGCACAGNAGNVFPPQLVRDPDMHHGTCVTHVPWCLTGSLTSGFLWSRWREKRSRHSRRMRNPQFRLSGKRPIDRPVKTVIGGDAMSYNQYTFALFRLSTWFLCNYESMDEHMFQMQLQKILCVSVYILGQLVSRMNEIYVAEIYDRSILCVIGAFQNLWKLRLA